MAKNISTFYNLRPSKIYPNWDVWFDIKINHLATLVAILRHEKPVLGLPTWLQPRFYSSLNLLHCIICVTNFYLSNAAFRPSPKTKVVCYSKLSGKSFE
jgi:hypothetical protein